MGHFFIPTNNFLIIKTVVNLIFPQNVAKVVLQHKKCALTYVAILTKAKFNTKVTLNLAKQQIRIAFEQAEKEVQDLHQRTKEGIETARLNGKQIGQKQGATLNVKEKGPAKKQIRELSKDFDGSNTDIQVMKITGLSKNTYYKYKKELLQELLS